MTRILRLSCLAFGVLVATASAALAKPTIAILGLEVIDKSGAPTPADTQFASSLTTELRGRAKFNSPYDLSTSGNKELLDEKLLKSCDDEKPVCMQVIGRDVNAQFVIYGHIEKQGSAYQVTVVLFDVDHKAREHTYTELVPFSDVTGPSATQGIGGWARKIYAKLTGQSDGCTIVVKSTADSGTILVNGAPKGTIANGQGTINALPEGRYKIAVEAEHFHRWEKSDVTCTAGQTANISAEPERADPVVVPPPSGVGQGQGSGLGPEGPGPGPGIGTGPTTSVDHTWRNLAIVGGAVTVASAVTLIVARHELVTTGKQTTGTWEYGRLCVPGSGPNGFVTGAPGACASGNAYKDTTIVATGFMAAGAIFTAIAVYKAFEQSKEEHQPIAGRKAHHSTFAVTPVITPTGAGGVVQLEW